jgi:hypothetical protein
MRVYGTGISIIPQRYPDGIVTARAWRVSRPNHKSFEMADVMKVDVPVNELEDFILVVTAPILVREMFFTLREHVAWARTSRVDDLNEWPIYHTFAKHPEIILLYNMMREGMAKGEPQDHFRSALPLMYMTSFTLKISVRTLMKFRMGLVDFMQFNKLLPSMQTMWNELIKEIDYAIGLTPWKDVPKDVYGKMPVFNQSVFAVADGPSATCVGSFVNVQLPEIPIGLRAQIVRHRPIQFVDTLAAYVNAPTAPIASKLSMELMMSIPFAFSLVAKRNCWIAQADIWEPVVTAINQAIGADTGMISLPCSDKLYCPYGQDNQLRFEKRDPAPPCPIWAQLAAVAPSMGQYDKIEMMKYAHARPQNVTSFWDGAIDQAIPDQGA